MAIELLNIRGGRFFQSVAPTGARRHMAHTATLRYSYTNRQPAPIELWIALPPLVSTQGEVELVWHAAQPLSIALDGAGVNSLAYFRLPPGAQVEATVRARLYRVAFDAEAAGAPPLTPEKQRFYTRSSPMIVVDDEVRGEAMRIVGGASDPLEQARRLYAYLVRNYRYVWPPAERGSTATRRTRSGDCGEFAFVYAAWCRSLDLPCRVLFGTWAGGKTAAHAWNEVYIAGAGWLPVDASVYATRLGPLGELDRTLRGAWRSFGRLGGDRIAFSIDPDVALVPAFRDRQPQASLCTRMGGRELSWGYTSLDGAAPYLQPAYPRFGDGAPATSDDLLGSWRVAEPPPRRAVTWLISTAFALGVAALILDLIGIAGLDLPRALAWFVGSALLIGQTGASLWKLSLLLLFFVQLVAQLWAAVGA